MSKKIRMLEEKTKHIRSLILEMCAAAGTGHVTSAYSCVEIMVTLYYGGILRVDPKNPNWPKRDRFILSKGQASVILYPILADLGFFPLQELDHFCQANGRFGVHLQHDVPGVETTSGSLGHGLSIATGLAYAAKLNRESHITVALLGDGECYSGPVWEAAMFASHNRLSNLIAIVDRNYICATNFTEDSVQLEPLDAKWTAFGWNTIRLDGHSIPELLSALGGCRSRKSSRPLLIIADTVKGKGVPFMSDDPMWHAVAPKGEEVHAARTALQNGE